MLEIIAGHQMLSDSISEMPKSNSKMCLDSSDFCF